MPWQGPLTCKNPEGQKKKHPNCSLPCDARKPNSELWFVSFLDDPLHWSHVDSPGVLRLQITDNLYGAFLETEANCTEICTVPKTLR